MAQFNLGITYASGRGVIEDEAEAVKWYRLAAEQGYANAQYSLGNMYASGRGVIEDEAEAVKWYRFEVTPLLWTVYGFRIKPHLSASIHS